jgi:type II secretory pathway predicted ATPase ExeA
MYYSHFGLTGPPFQLTSSPAQLYMSKEHREAYAALERGSAARTERIHFTGALGVFSENSYR